MIKSILIPVHSFVDLITNSSSEIFVSATENTVTTAKAVVNSILRSQGILDKTVDDLFTVKLSWAVKNYEATEGEFTRFDTEEAREAFMEEKEIDGGDEYTTLMSYLVIEPKDSKDASLKAVADALHAFLGSTESFEGQY